MVSPARKCYTKETLGTILVQQASKQATPAVHDSSGASAHTAHHITNLTVAVLAAQLACLPSKHSPTGTCVCILQGHGHGGGGKQDKKAIPIPDIMEVETHYRDYLPLFSPPLTYLHGKGARLLRGMLLCGQQQTQFQYTPPVAAASKTFVLLFKRHRCPSAVQCKGFCSCQLFALRLTAAAAAAVLPA
jgi:hypothetical protein